MRRLFVLAGIVAIFLFCVCALYWLWPRRVPEKRLEFPLNPVSADNLPRFTDDLKGVGLIEAIEHHLASMESRNLDDEVTMGQLTVTRGRIVKTLQSVQQLIKEKGMSALYREIPKRFLVYQAAGLSNKGDVLFTGYYQPVLNARREPDNEYKYPIYAMPQDLQILDLGKINSKYAGERIGLRVENGIIKPYHDRKAIDAEMVLGGKGLELLYLNDFLDRYLLHIQGSGIMKVEGGGEIKVRYAASNGFPYVSLGKLLIEEQKIPPDQMSLKAIREYYEDNPQEIEQYLNRNPRYIFFEEFSGTVSGSEGVPLTPERSIATDKSLFPGGGLAFIICKKPHRNAQGEVVRWDKMHRFVIDQDTGAAIKGPGRVDVFWGTGAEAEKNAGGFKEMGELFYLLIKEDELN